MQDNLYDEMYQLEEKHWWFKSKRKIILELINQELSGTENEILDCGCGCGCLLKYLKIYGNVKGIDYSARALAYSKKNFDGDLVQSDLLKKVELPDESVDLAIALDVIEHLEDDELGLKNIRRVLKTNGKLLVTVPAFKQLWSYHDVEHMHKRRYTIKQLERVLKKSGYSIAYISYYNFWLFLPIYVARKIKNKINDCESDASMPSPFVNFLLEKIFSTETFLCRHRVKMPVGVSIIAIVNKSIENRN